MLALEIEFLTLHLTDPFKLSYGTSNTRQNVLVHLTDDGLRGVGEAAVVPYYGETPQRVAAYLSDPALLDLLAAWREDFQATIAALPFGHSMPARNALVSALYDLWAQSLGQPLYKLWGLNPARTPRNSFTVAMADDETSYRHKLRQAAGYPLIKLKLGAPSRADDMALVHIAKSELPDAEFCIDANAAWSAPETLDLLPQLDELGILFIEQPLAKDDWMGWETLQKQRLSAHPPLIADESVQGLASLERLVGLIDGINIKLAKCGGLDQAQQMITVGRFFGLQIMLGCMIESSVGVTAASHLAPLADYLDLDGNLLIQNDPYQGMTVQGGVVCLPANPGLGLVRI